MANTNWQGLKAEFLANQTHKEVRSWLRDTKKWSNSKLNSGNTKQHTAGWSTEWAQIQHQIFETSITAVKEIQKQKLIAVAKAKNLAIDKIVGHLEATTSLKDVILCMRALQAELDANKDVFHKNEQDDPSTATLNAVRELIDAVSNARVASA